MTAIIAPRNRPGRQQPRSGGDSGGGESRGAGDDRPRGESDGPQQSVKRRTSPKEVKRADAPTPSDAPASPEE